MIIGRSRAIVDHDAFFSDVILLSGFEGEDGYQGTILDESSYLHTINITAATNNFISTTSPLWGDSSLQAANTSGANIVSATTNAIWDISQATSDQFVIEYTLNLQDAASTVNTISNFSFVAGLFAGWLVRNDTSNLVLFWGNSVGGLEAITAVGGSQAGTHEYAVSKDSGGKIRLFKDGVMLTSSTPSDSVFASSGNPLILAPSGPAQINQFDEVRITVGTDRGYHDSGYTVQTGPFPRS